MKFPLVIAVTVSTFALLINGYPRKTTDNKELKTSISQQSTNDEANADLNTEEVGDDAIQQDQTFYPSFSPVENQPLGHSRPYFYQQEAAYSQRAVSPYQQQLSYDTYRGGGFPSNQAANTYGLLGSGNFGVIQGGTFYNDNDGASSNFEQAQYSSYYHNGHGRPSDYFSSITNPRPQKQEQFANFRDFADINTPSYSEYVVVYANKNNSQENEHHAKPKNIMEQLALLDLDPITTTTTTELPTKKLSKSKRKLALLVPEKKTKQKELKKKLLTVDLHEHEPLLALS